MCALSLYPRLLSALPLLLPLLLLLLPPPPPHHSLTFTLSLTLTLTLSLSLSAVLSLVTIKKLECLKQVLLLECWPLHIAVWNNRLDLCLSAGHTPGLRFAGCAARGLDSGCSLVLGEVGGEQGSAAEVGGVVSPSIFPFFPPPLALPEAGEFHS